MQNKSRTFFFFSILYCCAFLAHAQSSKPFPPSQWYVAETNTKGSLQKFGYGENVVSLLDSNKYMLNNFLGISKQEGFYLVEDDVLVLNYPQKDAYFWVFKILSSTKEQVVLKYIPYKPSLSSMEVKLLPYIPQSQTIDSTKRIQDFSGEWVYNFENSQLNIKIVQSGAQIIGEHCTKVSCETKYELSGVVNDKGIAEISIFNDKKELMGKASMSKIGNFANWLIMGEKGKLDTIDRAILQRK
jgi:hypothetical protein